MSGPSAAPVIAIDGPTASGKGTIAAGVAKRLAFNYLDSGSLYRLVSLEAQVAGVELDDEPALIAIAGALRPEFVDGRIRLDGQDVSDQIREEGIGAAASRLAVLPGVRQALVDIQRRFRTSPGLVADGRDMGTAIFPDAKLKIFLTADVQSRAERRHKQLIEKGFSSNITGLSRVLRDRDNRDANRAVSPLRAAEDAIVIDSTHLSIEQTIEQVLGAWKAIAGGAVRG
ncbi:MAG: (d)CMP kinase [Lautropia sp.]|nr:(d)CMP kinase [Lautropia sp.]